MSRGSQDLPSRNEPKLRHRPPSVEEVAARLRELYGQETVLNDGRTARWWVTGARPDTGVALWMERTAPAPGEPCVVWVTRPGEDKPERCPIATMSHLTAFLALVSIARKTPEPVHGNVCPGEN